MAPPSRIGRQALFRLFALCRARQQCCRSSPWRDPVTLEGSGNADRAVPTRAGSGRAAARSSKGPNSSTGRKRRHVSVLFGQRLLVGRLCGGVAACEARGCDPLDAKSWTKHRRAGGGQIARRRASMRPATTASSRRRGASTWIVYHANPGPDMKLHAEAFAAHPAGDAVPILMPSKVLRPGRAPRRS
jgi:hypothetical protein